MNHLQNISFLLDYKSNISFSTQFFPPEFKLAPVQFASVFQLTVWNETYISSFIEYANNFFPNILINQHKLDSCHEGLTVFKGDVIP